MAGELGVIAERDDDSSLGRSPGLQIGCFVEQVPCNGHIEQVTSLEKFAVYSLGAAL